VGANLQASGCGQPGLMAAKDAFAVHCCIFTEFCFKIRGPSTHPRVGADLVLRPAQGRSRRSESLSTAQSKSEVKTSVCDAGKHFDHEITAPVASIVHSMWLVRVSRPPRARRPFARKVGRFALLQQGAEWGR
jgi:hypothetical protein